MGEYVELPDYPSHHLPQCLIGLPSFADALAEPSHGRVGANDAVADAVCQRYHGMSQEEWDAVPDEGWDSP